ncbi:MAG: MbtH family NRPS accessory protein [Bacteroidaceae bacterium]|nr:MbtH family NRPS accessory protein [Bacteroidaceae bacterium]
MHQHQIQFVDESLQYRILVNHTLQYHLWSIFHQ